MLRERDRRGAAQQFAAEGVAPEQVTFRCATASLRYQNQEHSVEVLLAGGAIDGRLGGDRRRLPPGLRARVHLPARRAGRDRRHPPRRDRRGRQARSRRRAETGAPRRGRSQRAGARSTTRASGVREADDLRRRPARAGHDVRGPGDRRDRGQHDGRSSGQPRRRSTTTATSSSRSRRAQAPDGRRDGPRADPITLEIIQNSLQATATRCSPRSARPR